MTIPFEFLSRGNSDEMAKGKLNEAKQTCILGKHTYGGHFALLINILR